MWPRLDPTRRRGFRPRGKLNPRPRSAPLSRFDRRAVQQAAQRLLLKVRSCAADEKLDRHCSVSEGSEREMKFTLGKKLGLGFGVILCLMVFNSAISYLKSSTIKQSQDFTFELRYPTLETARRLQRDLNQTQSKGRQVILAGAEPAKREAGRKLFEEAWNDIDKEIAQLDELAPKWALQSNRDDLREIKKVLPALRA